MSASWEVYGNANCPRCGVRVAVAELLGGAHACDPCNRHAHEARLLGEKIEVTLFEVEDFLWSDQTRNRRAFAAWCREHGR